jgi:hypothetical protein
MSLEWAEALDAIRPHIFRLETRSGSGTAFVIDRPDAALVLLATAYHVFEDSIEWREPIKLIHHESQKIMTLADDERMVRCFPEKDLALIQFDAGGLPLSDVPPETIVHGEHYREGIQIGWCGFPSVAPRRLCFFTGHISAYVEDDSYLVDGVAINGVSGGPAFAISDTGAPELFGVVTSYFPNRQGDEVLPGLSWVRGISPYLEP